MKLTTQLFSEIKKHPQEERFYMEALKIELFHDYPSPHEEDWSKWNSIEFQELPSKVQSQWVKKLKLFNIQYIYSLQVALNGNWWYIDRWDMIDDKRFFLPLPFGQLEVNGESMLSQDWMPCPDEQVRIETETVWQGYHMPDKAIIRSCVTAYKFGREQRTKEVIDFLNK